MTQPDQLSKLAQNLMSKGHYGSVVLIVPVTPQAGASTVCAQLAKRSAELTQRSVWIYDLDFYKNIQAQRAPLSNQVYCGDFSGLGFWATQPNQVGKLVMRQAQGWPIFISQFQAQPGALKSVSFRREPNYWTQVRQHTGLSLVDMPYNSAALHTICPDMDGVILVVDAQRSHKQDAENLSRKIEQLGGNVWGVVVNRQYRAVA